jgi:hypothetical protein
MFSAEHFRARKRKAKILQSQKGIQMTENTPDSNTVAKLVKKFKREQLSSVRGLARQIDLFSEAKFELEEASFSRFCSAVFSVPNEVAAFEMMAQRQKKTL